MICHMHKTANLGMLLVCLAAIGACNAGRVPTRATLEEQEKCSRLAEKLVGQYERDFKSDKYSTGSAEPSINQENHFNSKLMMCFVQVQIVHTNPFSEGLELWNGFENRRLGSFYQSNQYPVTFCSVTTPSGEKSCKSKEEFLALAKVYTDY
jgi:hypothetical protein